MLLSFRYHFFFFFTFFIFYFGLYHKEHCWQQPHRNAFFRWLSDTPACESRFDSVEHPVKRFLEWDAIATVLAATEIKESTERDACGGVLSWKCLSSWEVSTWYFLSSKPSNVASFSKPIRPSVHMHRKRAGFESPSFTCFPKEAFFPLCAKVRGSCS